MKKMLLSLFFLLVCSVINAQDNNVETLSADFINTTETKCCESNLKNTATRNIVQNKVNESDIIYSKLSKVTFFEVLISKNKFDILLKDSNRVAIKNTEEIITKKRDQILYSELDNE